MSRAHAATATIAPGTTLDPGPLRPKPRPAAKRRTSSIPAVTPTQDAAPATRASLDPEMAVALIELLREQRADAAFGVADAMRARGADPVVCDFLGDDLREAAHALADVEGWLQCTLDVLDRPSASTLFEQASDVGVLGSLEHLFQTVDNLRRRLMQASVGLR